MAQVTQHASERYCERVDPRLSLEQARQRIMASARAIDTAADFGAPTVIAGRAKLLLDGDTVTTVIPKHWPTNQPQRRTDMNAVTAIAPAADEVELFGPDLRTLPSLAEQIATLDKAATWSPLEYAAVWLLESDRLASGAQLLWRRHDAPDAAPALFSGHAFDDQEVERRERWEALHAHHAQVEGFRPAIQQLLISQGRFIDNRRTEARS